MGIDQVYALTKHQEEFPKPARIKKDIAKRDCTKYCAFRRDIGHNTSDCFNLKETIEALIRRERLQKYRRQGLEQSDEKDDKQYNEIAIIAGRPHIVGTSRRAQKSYIREGDAHSSWVMFTSMSDRASYLKLKKKKLSFLKKMGNGYSSRTMIRL